MDREINMEKPTIRVLEHSKFIIELRGTSVILDFHLAALYGVETRALKQQVRRNLNRFPPDFMFELTADEINGLLSQIVIPEKRILGGSTPMAFTEQGVAMLSSVLRSVNAIEVNIAIMRTFVQVRKMMYESTELRRQIESLEKKYDEQFRNVFNAIRKLVEKKNEPRRAIGYKIPEKQ